jgi:serine/threonine protein kinase
LWKREPIDNHLYVKLADFGEAKTNVRNSTSDQQQTWLVGTTGWRAPELSGEHMLTHKRYPLMVDVFSFGMTFFEVLTGQGPFQAEQRMNVQTRIDRGERPDLPKTCPLFLFIVVGMGTQRHGLPFHKSAECFCMDRT